VCVVIDHQPFTSCLSMSPYRISIGSAVFAQLTAVSNTQTHTHTLFWTRPWHRGVNNRQE